MESSDRRADLRAALSRRKLIYGGVAFLVLLLYPAPFHPLEAILRWRAFVWSRQFVWRMQSIDEKTLDFDRDYCKSKESDKDRLQGTADCDHVNRLRHVLKTSYPIHGDFAVPTIGEATVRNSRGKMPPAACMGQFRDCQKIYTYFISVDGWICIRSECDEMSIDYAPQNVKK